MKLFTSRMNGKEPVLNALRINNRGRRLSQPGTGTNRSRVGVSFLAAAALLVFAASVNAQATKLRIQPVSSPQVAGQPFDIVVQSLNAADNPMIVVVPREISLTLQAGSGALIGNIEGVLGALSDTTTLQGVVYDTAETGVVIRASDTFPGNLTPGDSNAIDFLHGDLQIGDVALATAGPASDLSITYSVVTELAAVPSFNINVGVDTDNDDAMDTFLGALTPPTVMLTPGTHVFTADIRPLLNALAPKIKHSDNIVVRLDPADAVKETDESNASNKMVSDDIFVDIQPIGLSLIGSTQARFAYNVMSVANVEDLTVAFYLDDSAPFGDLNVGDTPVDSFVVSSQDVANVEPGGHEVIGDFTGFEPATNQFIFAVVDWPDTVVEANEGLANIASTANSEETDLQALQFYVWRNPGDALASAALNFRILSPAPVGTFNVRIGVDRAPVDGVIDSPADVLLAGPVVGPNSPGWYSYFLPNSLDLDSPVLPLKHGDLLVMTLDLTQPGGDEGGVEEIVTLEVANNFTWAISTVDVVANGVDVTANTFNGATTAKVYYNVNSIGAVAPFNIRIGVDQDGNGEIDAGGVLATEAVSGNKLKPGDRTVNIPDFRAALDALATPIQDDDWIVATIDLDDTHAPESLLLIEWDEVANNAVKQKQLVDLVAISLSYDSNTESALLSYGVNSIGNVADYDIEFHLDSAAGPLVGTFNVGTLPAVSLVPGTHTLAVDLPAPLSTGQLLFAVMDTGAAVDEQKENNNKASTTNTAGTDLVAVSLDVVTDDLASTTVATFDYFVGSPTAVADFTLRVGVDRFPADGLIDDLLLGGPVLLIGGDVDPGFHVWSQDIRGDLNTLGTPLGDGDEIVATLDLTLAGADELAVVESEEVLNNAAASQAQQVDLVANAVTVFSDDVLGTTTAQVAYTINSPSDVGAFEIKIGIDTAPGDNTIDSPAVVLTTFTPAPVDLEPGSHVVDIPNFRGAIDGLGIASRIQNGDRILATIDLTQPGGDEGVVSESEDITNNIVGETQVVDLVATSVAVLINPDTDKTKARVYYNVNSIGAVAPFNIRIGVDKNNNGIIDPGSLLDTIDLALAGYDDQVKPGPQEVTSANFRAALNALTIEKGDRIIATLDLKQADSLDEGLVAEMAEESNNIATQKQAVDLVAESIFLTIDNATGTTAATVTYTINSPGAVAPFNLRIGIDRDADDRIDDADPGDLLLTAGLTGADLTPGPHTFFEADIRGAIDALTPELKSGDRIIATLDFTIGAAGADEAAVNEDEEDTNNVTTITGTQEQIVDISGDELTLTVGSFIATVNYTVTSPGNVAPFTIRLGRDTNADDIIDDFLVDIVGEVTPGAHQASEDLAALLLGLGVLSGENVTIVADFDADDTVAEAEEITNNKLVNTEPYLVDLLAVRLTHPCAVLDTVFDVEFDYTVVFNQPNEDFTVCVYASENDTPTIGGGDVLLGCLDVTNPANKTVGDHTVVISGVSVNSANFATGYFFVKAMIDSPLTVNEANEGNNVAVRPNAAQDPSEDPDGDGVPSCFDGCPNDPNKLDPGVCGCGVVDDLTDTDGDGLVDCLDPDPNDPDNPVPQGAPGGQTTPGDGNGLDIFLPILPLGPPMCGIGLCGGGTMVPVSMMLLGFVGLRLRRRSRQDR